jgi:predicted ATPase
MGMKIKQLDMAGFRSLRQTSWFPGDLNVIIGPNGSGKSNVLRVLELLALSAQGQLGKTIQSMGGMEPLLWDGAVDRLHFVLHTEPIGDAKGPEQYQLELVRLGNGSSYKIAAELLANTGKFRAGGKKEPFKFLTRQAKNAVVFDENQQQFATPEEYVADEESLLSGPFTQNRAIPPYQRELAAITVYRDLNTGPNAPIRQATVSRIETRVDQDGQNLIAVLHTLYTGNREFKNEINLAMKAAFGDDFDELVFPPAADQRIQLRVRWKSLRREQSASDLSDGTLRFLFLLAVLASPNPAPVIAIDEPETGLHPAMLPVIAEYAVEAASRSQIIFTTHSPQLLDAFTEKRPTTTVAHWEDGETRLRTIANDDLAYWLQEYSLGTLFKSGELEQMA